MILLDDPANEQARLGLAEVLIARNRFAEGLEILIPLDSFARNRQAASLLAANALLALHRPYEAIRALEGADSPDALVMRAKALGGAGRGDEAAVLLEALIQTEPGLPEAVQLRRGVDSVATADFAYRLAEGVTTQGLLADWGSLYVRLGRFDLALICFDRSLELDPEYFPARMGRAEALSYAGRRAESLEALQSLDRDFPETSKILLTRARVLAWDRQYDKAVEEYEKLHALSPQDPVPVREMARTRFWQKQGEEGARLYETVLDLPVDTLLAEGLEAISKDTGQPLLAARAEALRKGTGKDSVSGGWTGYESFAADFKDMDLSDDARREVGRLLLRLEPTYRIQKIFSLEKEAKLLAFNRRFLPAMDGFESLTTFEPDNQEALFDKAQAACALGLCAREREAYEALLEIDPRHTLAAPALQRLDHRQAPTLTLGGNFWNEEGHGHLSAMNRYRTDLAGEAPLDLPAGDAHRMRLVPHHWVEAPMYTSTVYQAWGQTLGLYGLASEEVAYDLAWTSKFYDRSGLDPVFTGRARLEYNFDDQARIGASYERAEEMVNLYALLQQIATDNLGVDWKVPVSRKFEVSGYFKNRWFTDDNSQRHARLDLGYGITDHPRELKIILNGEWRDTDSQASYHYDGDDLVDITHPYWTPQDYFSGGATLEWRHDLAGDAYCGARRHWYDIQISTGNGTPRTTP